MPRLVFGKHSRDPKRQIRSGHPGTTEFVLHADHLPMGPYVAMELSPGEYQFKAVGHNATGDGPESEAFAVTVS